MLRRGLIVSLFALFGCSASAGPSERADGSGQGGTGGATGGSTSGSGGMTTAAGGSSANSGGAAAAGGTAPGAGGALGTGGFWAGGGRATVGGANQAGDDESAAGSTPIASHTNPLSKYLIDAFVAAHNAARASTSLNPQPSPALPPVSWDPILADTAYNYLSKCVSSDGQLVDHNKNRASDYQALGGTDKYVGENIYATTGNTVAPADAVNSWMSEASKYDYSKNDFSNAGHYTQVVWRDSVRIGCAIVNCANARYNNTVLCDYAPGGNITGQKPY
jgi:uncharacterized protein YkwD